MRLIFYLRPEEDLGPMPQEKVRPKLLEHRVALGPTFSRCPPLIPLSTFAYSELGLIVIKQFWLQCIQSEMKGGGGKSSLGTAFVVLDIDTGADHYLARAIDSGVAISCRCSGRARCGRI